MKLPTLRHSRSNSSLAFTIIEIAICLGIIAFALVAIIAALPRGLDVQKRNREETIIGQDSEVWMNLIRNGSQGYDDLTNYVLVITNIWTRYDNKYAFVSSNVDYYTPSSSVITSITPPPDFALTNGARIIGLLSMPKFVPDFIEAPPSPYFQSNYVIAYVRAFSGAIVDKVPQTNSIVLSSAFTYRMIVENFPYAPVDTNAFCMDCAATNGLTDVQMVDRTNLLNQMLLLRANARDFRLRFRWPVLPNGQIPNYGLATFRAMASGQLRQTNDALNIPSSTQPMYFVLASTYTNLP